MNKQGRAQISEGLQASDRGFAIEEAADNLDSVVSSLQTIDAKSEVDDITSNTEGAVGYLQDAKG